MRYGLEVPVGGACADPRFLAELARDAEDTGFEAVFLEDHITYWAEPGRPIAEPWVALAAMAPGRGRCLLVAGVDSGRATCRDAWRRGPRAVRAMVS